MKVKELIKELNQVNPELELEVYWQDQYLEHKEIISVETIAIYELDTLTNKIIKKCERVSLKTSQTMDQNNEKG